MVRVWPEVRAQADGARWVGCGCRRWVQGGGVAGVYWPGYTSLAWPGLPGYHWPSLAWSGLAWVLSSLAWVLSNLAWVLSSLGTVWLARCLAGLVSGWPVVGEPVVSGQNSS